MRHRDRILLWASSSQIVRLLVPFYVFIAQRVGSRRRLTQCLFDVRLPEEVEVSWDSTTLVLRHALLKRASVGGAALEIGVGQGALLCIYLAHKLGVKADGVDVAEHRVRSSQRVAKYNGIPLRLWQSDLFEKVQNRYDMVFFNAPYIPTEFGNLLNLGLGGQLDDDRSWDGGPDGTDTIARFLAQAPDFLTRSGEILLGVNNFYIPDARMSGVIQASPLVLVDRITLPLNPSTVYVLCQEGGSGWSQDLPVFST